MAFKMAIISREPSGGILAAGYGEATARDFPSTAHVHFDALIGADWARHTVILDMDAVSYVDSSAIGWLIQSQKQFRDAGGMLVLHSVQPHVRDVLKLLKIQRVVPIARDATECHQLIQEVLRAKVVA